MSVPRASDIRTLTEKPLEPSKFVPSKLPTPLPIPQPRLPLPRKRDNMSHFERIYYQNTFGQFEELDEYEPFKDRSKRLKMENPRATH